MSSTLARNLTQENIIRKVFDPSTDSLKITGSISTTAPVGGATEAKQDAQITSLGVIETNTTPLKVFGTSSLIDVSSTNIPGSASLPLELIASTAQDCKQIQIIEDIGEYMALYTGAASSEVLLCALPLGGGEVLVDVPAGTRISIKALKTSAIASTTNLIINLIG